MASDNIFSGLKVVDFASFIAGPGAAVILSDFGADVIKVEPPVGDLWRHGHLIPPQPQAKDAYPWHLANRNKRGMTLDLKSPGAQSVLEKLVKWADVFIVNTPHPARKKLKLEYDDVAQWNPRLIYADLTGFGEKGPDADLPGFDITSYWARSGHETPARRRPGRLPAAATMPRPSASIPRSSRRFIGASAPAKGHMSQHRCSPRVSGRRASRSRPHWSGRSFSPRMTARIRPMPR
jgi:crotonobetainyl-CoA:carnitine CoA-transferase CaiB-like acyl-CoA transferase